MQAPVRNTSAPIFARAGKDHPLSTLLPNQFLYLVPGQLLAGM